MPAYGARHQALDEYCRAEQASIEDHGYEIFNTCLSLAQHAGICLSSPEKYLLHCAAFLHDLGYYRGYTRAKAGQYPGWRLLRLHGSLTEELLREKFQEDPDSLDLITPRSYRQVAGGSSFRDLLCSLCAAHSGLVEPAEIENCNLIVEEAEVPVRFSLLVALFAVAEDLTEGHPFFPSADPVGPARRKDADGKNQGSTKDTWAIVDPVLDLYLHQERPIVFDPRRRRVTVTRRSVAVEEERPATVEWLLTMAAGHIKRFDLAAQNAGGWGIELVCDFKPELPESMKLQDVLDRYEDLLCRTLAENFALALGKIEKNSIGGTVSILDLISIYTMSTPVKDRAEPRISLASQTGEPSVLDQALGRMERPARRKQILSMTGLFADYLSRKRSGKESWSALDRVFMASYDDILLPASRFFGRNWHDGIESTLMARICFDMGYSPFRSEVMSGLRSLLEEKVLPGAKDGHAHAHNQCTICTSRLLYIFTHAKRLIPQEQLDRYAKGLEETIASILRYMIDLGPKDDIWWGLQPDGDHKGQIKSAEYLAWAARAVTCCLSLDLELRKRGVDKDWLGQKCGLDRDELNRLVGQRWDHLLSADEPLLLSPLAEEPHSFVFGHVALACLDLQRLDPEIRELAVGGRETKIGTFSEALQAAAKDIGTLSQLSGFFLWPLKLFLDSLGDSKAAEDAVKLCYSCVESPVWITTGADAGSWGFNVKNTQTIVTSLMAFWQYVFEGDEQHQARFRDLFEKKESEKAAAAR
ncbi:MAG: hypothetical protein QOH06_5515 [Acidobacteriota bacterium]|nr:hypothetical protein [Acidobacteriota bacterium]